MIAPRRWPPAGLVCGAAFLLFVTSLAVFRPGFAMYDSVMQYGQVLAGRYDDWHPPVMARLWALLGGEGAGRMFTAQIAAWWLGLALLAARLTVAGRCRAAAAMLGIGLFPPFLGWQVVVLKDAQMTSALVAATGLAMWDGAAGRWRVARFGGLTLLLAYAVLARANAVFAVVPFVVLLSARPAGPAWRLAIGMAGIVAILLIAPTINHRVLGAAASGVEKSQALFDLGGIAGRVPDAGDTGVLPGEAAAIVVRHCASPYFWDPLGDDHHCGTVMERLRDLPAGRLYALLAGSAARHPVAYARHRLAHLNSTLRWIVPHKWPGAAPPERSEPNDVGLSTPGGLAPYWQRLAAMMVETPLGWPVAWLVAAIIGLAAVPVDGAARRLAFALFGSAVALEASFAVISVASDLRYHLWPMVATAIGWVLALDGAPIRRRAASAGSVALALVIVGGVAARITLPTPPQSYIGMLGWTG